MMMMSYGLTGERPFKHVFLHGLIFGKSYYRRRGGDLELISPAERRELKLDELDKLPKDIEYRWEKMSKSKGNVIDPIEMFEIYGVDATRIALAAYSGQGRTIEIDRQRIAGYRNFINKLWNASRFVLQVTEGISAEEFGAVAEGDLAREDRWILHRLSETIAAATDAIAAYDFTGYVQAIYQFLWNDYCDWYVELVKGRVYGREGDAASTLAAKNVLLSVLEQTLRLLHPVIPFATEEIWQLLKERYGSGDANRRVAGRFADTLITAPSLCVAAWPNARDFREPVACDEVEFLRNLIGSIRNIRGEMAVPLEMKVEVHAAHPDAAWQHVLRTAAGQIGALANVKDFLVAGELPSAAFASTAVSGDLRLQVVLPAELREAEVTRLEKELGRLEKGLTATRSKLTNEKFVASAPEAVVAKEREKLAGYEAEMAAIHEKLTALRA
jgi:valyl-tRNA synthetase